MFSVLTWLRAYQYKWLRADLIAGVTLAAYLMPAGLADASLANLPPEAGLYACLFSGLVFWLFCSSRHTAITVTSAISLLVGASLGEIAAGAPRPPPAPAPRPPPRGRAPAGGGCRRPPPPAARRWRRGPRCWSPGSRFLPMRSVPAPSSISSRKPC